MADFDVIESGFNVADETINFGNRCLAEEGNLHEAATLAVLKCQSESEHLTVEHFNGIVKNGNIHLTINKSLKVFNDTGEVINTACFNNIIDTLSITSDGKYILLCLRNGSIYLLDSESFECISKESINLDQDLEEGTKQFFVNTFLEQNTPGGCFYTVTTPGNLYRIELTSELTLSLEMIYDFDIHIKIASYSHPYLLVNGAHMCALNLIDKQTKTRLGTTLDISYLAPNAETFLALNTEGELFVICPITLFTINIRNATFYSEMEAFYNAEAKISQILAMCEQTLHLLSFEGETLFTMKVPHRIHMITPENRHDEILYVSEIAANELRLQRIYENEPQKRLERLLRQNRYQEAETFARFHRLDASLISKAKIRIIIDQQSCGTEDIDALLTYLNNVRDDCFVYGSILAMEISCQHCADLDKLLAYGRAYKPLQKGHEYDEMQRQINEISHKFVTFTMIYGRNAYTLDKWAKFSHCDLISQVRDLLNNNCIEQATLTYSRLSPRVLDNLDVATVESILQMLYKKPIEAHRCFLPTFIRITLNHVPFAIGSFVKFVHNIIFLMQRSQDSSSFPNIALDYIAFLMKMMGDNNQHCVHYNEGFKSMSAIFTALKRLKILKEEYSINATLPQLLMKPEEVVASFLNDAIPPELFKKFLKQFLATFIIEHNLDSDAIFYRRITDIILDDEAYWNLNCTLVILDCIACVSTKLDAIINILDAAAVPWSPEIRAIAHIALNYDEVNLQISAIKNRIKNEPIQIVLQRPEYKIRERIVNLDGDDFEFFAQRIIYCQTATMVKDVYAICTNETFRHSANLLLITHFIFKGAYDEAMEILMKNSDEEILKCTKYFMVYFQEIVNEPTRNYPQEKRRHCYNIAHIMVSKLNEYSQNKFDVEWNQNIVMVLKRMHEIQEKFGVETNYAALWHSHREDQVIGEVLSKVIDPKDQDLGTTLAKCYKAAKVFGRSPGDILLKCSSQVDELGFMCKIAQHLLVSDEPHPTNLRQCALNLLKALNLDIARTIDLDHTFCGDLKITNNSEMYASAIDLAAKLATKCIISTNQEDAFVNLEVLKWTRTALDINTSLRSNVIWINNDQQIYHFLGRILTLLSNAISKGKSKKQVPTLWMFDHDINVNEEQLLEELSSTLMMLGRIFQDGQHCAAYEVMMRLYCYLSANFGSTSKTCQYLSETLGKECIARLLYGIVGVDDIDGYLLYNIASKWQSKEEASHFVKKVLRASRTRPKKLRAVLKVGLKLFSHFHIEDVGKDAMVSSLVTMKWWMKLNSSQLNYQKFFTATPEQRLVNLIEHNLVDLESIRDYCDDYRVEYQSAYEAYLKTALFDSTLDYEIKTADNVKTLTIKHTDKDFVVKCEPIVELLPKEAALQILNLYKSLGNHYVYEVFEAVFELMNALEPSLGQVHRKEKDFLAFCRGYRRLRPPGEAEMLLWSNKFPESKSIDPLSEFRLPLTNIACKEDIKSIIRPEICLENYKTWFGSLPVLHEFLTKDDICVYAIKDIIHSGAARKNAAALNSQDIFLRKLEECVEHIGNLEIASSVLYYLMRNVPEGSGQVEIANLCYKYVNRYKHVNANSPTYSERTFTKVKNEYYNVCASHILQKYDLLHEKYLNIVTKPLELVESLYMDERIVKSGMCQMSDDINNAVTALATAFELDIVGIRKELIHRWIRDYVNTYFRAPNDTYLLRAVYCCMANRDYWQSRFIGLVFENQNISMDQSVREDSKSGFYKAVALKILSMISDGETIQRKTNMSASDLKHYSDKLIILASLHQYGHRIDLEKLDSCNKKELLKLIAPQCQDCAVLRIMAAICMTYEMYNINFWEFIVKNAVEFAMFSDVKTFLLFLTKNTNCYNKKFFIDAWQRLIGHTFVNLDRGMNNTLITTFLMVQSCPVIESIQFERIIEKCLSLDYANFAAILLQYYHGDSTQFIAQIQKCNVDLESLRNEGILGVDQVAQMLNRRI